MNYNLSNIKKAKYYLDKNECIGFPTETVYGLAANAYSKKATLKIFKLKKRNKRNENCDCTRKSRSRTYESTS